MAEAPHKNKQQKSYRSRPDIGFISGTNPHALHEGEPHGPVARHSGPAPAPRTKPEPKKPDQEVSNFKKLQEEIQNEQNAYEERKKAAENALKEIKHPRGSVPTASEPPKPEEQIGSGQKTGVKTGLGTAPDPKKSPLKSSALKPIRTYQGDIADAIKNQQASVLSISMAEKKRTEKKIAENPKSAPHLVEETKSAFATVLSVFLIIGGLLAIGGIYFVYTHQSGPTPVIDEFNTIIASDSQSKIPVDNLSRPALFEILRSDRQAIGVSSGSIHSFQLVEGTAIGTYVINAREFLEILGAEPPAGFIRSLEERYMIGAFGLGEGNVPFIVLRSDSFENAYPGMLSWESRLIEDVGPAFLEPEMVAPALRTPFTDLIINNRDARVVKDASNRTIFLYSFLDKNTIIMTTNESAYDDLFKKYVASGRVR